MKLTPEQRSKLSDANDLLVRVIDEIIVDHCKRYQRDSYGMKAHIELLIENNREWLPKLDTLEMDDMHVGLYMLRALIFYPNYHEKYLTGRISRMRL